MAAVDFEAVRKYQLQAKKLYEDPEFPASDSSLLFSARPSVKVTWMRPYEICQMYRAAPKFFSGGGSRFDIVQGYLGDCWVLAAAANISRFPKLYKKLVPSDQSFNKDWYAGMFHFYFWRYGSRLEVIIDDRLPTKDGKLIMTQSKDPTEFWGPLLEKAYAKVFGSYEAIKGGWNADSLTDFTGGIVESIQLYRPPSNLASKLSTATHRRSVMSASIYGDSAKNPIKANGLVMGHAYSVTGFTKVPSGEYLVRIRNPWGSDVEWNGRWSDSSPEWGKLPPESLKALGFKDKDDGEFWMSLDDFVKNYDSIEICNLSADSLLEDTKSWNISIVQSQWVEGTTAGGGPENSTYWMNPQFYLAVKDYDDDNDNLASMLVEIMQKNRRRNHLPYLEVAFFIHQVPPGSQLPLTKNQLKDNPPVASSGKFNPLRSTVARFNLVPGEYVIIPATSEYKQTGEFMLRVYSEAEHHTRTVS